MPTRKSGKRNIRKLTKLGGHSIGLTLPISIVRKLKWRERQKVVVKVKGRKITIEDWPASPKRNKGGKK
jgi:antitoxin component of MazEF toxin-antitoxin module